MRAIFMFVFQDVVWITIRDVRLKSPTIAVVWEGEGSQMFPSLDSVLSAQHLLSSLPVPQMSLYWYDLLFMHSPLTWEIGRMLWYQCQARKACWEGDIGPMLTTVFPLGLHCWLVSAWSKIQQNWVCFLLWDLWNWKICEASSWS